MTKRSNTLLKVAKELIVQCALRSSTMLERAQSTVLNLLNRLQDEVSYKEEDVEERIETDNAIGCRNCLMIFSLFVTHRGVSIGSTVTFYQLCPRCGSHATELGKLPLIITKEGKHYLGDNDGRLLGPFSSEEEAQEHLWDWFKEDKANASKGTQEEGLEEGHQEVARQGLRVIKGGKEDHQEVRKESRTEESNWRKS
jgi:hypothetical protein